MTQSGFINNKHYYHEPSFQVIRSFICDCEGNNKDEEGHIVTTHLNTNNICDIQKPIVLVETT